MQALTQLELAAGSILKSLAAEISYAIRAEVAQALASRAPIRHVPGRQKQSDMPIRLREAIAQVEREHIARALVENGDSVIRAARALGVPVTTLKYKLSKYRLR